VRGEQSERLFDLRSACFNRRLGELQALVGVFVAQADVEVLDNAVGAAAGLTSVDTCADVRALEAIVPRPEDPSIKRKVEAIEAQLAQATALSKAGKIRPGLELARRAAADAAAIDYAPIQGEALLVRGRSEQMVGDYKPALATFQEALLKSARGRDDTRLVWIWLEILNVVSNDESRYADALLLVPAVDAAVLRAGDQNAQRAGLELYIGQTLLSLGKPDETMRHYRRALSIVEADRSGDDVDRDRHAGSILRNIGQALNDRGAAKEALEANLQALTLLERSLGSEHPIIANVEVGIADALLSLGRFQEAEEHSRKALANLERSIGPKQSKVAPALLSLGNIQHALGRHADELASYERALSIREATRDSEDEVIADAAGNVGAALMEAKRYDEAERYFRRALRIYEKVLGPNHPNVAEMLASLVAVSLAHKNTPEALAEAERALRILKSAQLSPAQQSEIYVAVAKARWAGGDHRAAFAAVAQAQVALAHAGADEGETRKDLADWLATHR
jgi:tetratricopeptide (TPR) repeat protein